MTYEELMATILNSEFEDWLYDAETGRLTLRSDLDVQIKPQEREGPSESFTAEWANKHPDHNAFQYYYDIYYRASFVETFILIGVDGCRAYLPIPDTGTNTISYGKYQIAKAIDHTSRLDEYIQRSGLTVARPK